MTENEHTKINVAVIGGDRSVARTLKAHIDLLHELEQYRAIGTVESLKKLPAICDSLAESGMKAEKLIEELQAYRAIGTVEELKTMKENGAFTGVELAQILAMQMELKKYRSIGTIEEFKALKENSFFNFDSPVVRIDEKSYNKAIDEFAERLNKKIGDFVLEHKDNLDFASGISVAWNMVDEIAEQLKGVQE